MAREARRSQLPVPAGRFPRGDGPNRPAVVDPYVDWALGPGRPHYFRQEPDNRLMPLLLRLSLRPLPGRGPEELDLTLQEIGDRGAGIFFKLVLFATPPDATGQITIWIAVVLDSRRIGRIFSWAAAFDVLRLDSVSLGRLVGFPAMEALAAMPKPPPKAAQKRRPWRRQARRAAALPTVVMGIIDDGIAFAHERFRDSSGRSRVENCWLQGSGMYLTKGDIDALLADHADEEDLYRFAGLYDFKNSEHKSAAWRTAHGTHVMDLACGCNPADYQDDRPIVCVQLPVTATEDENPGTLYVWISLALDYIVNCAMAIAADRNVAPVVVVNLSYGLLAGPHDGTDEIEQYIDDKIRHCRDVLGVTLRVVLPAGNSYLSRIHARPSLAGEALTWRVQPDDRTPSFLEIWLPAPIPAPGNSRFTLTVTSPTGASMTTVEHGPLAQIAGTGPYAWAYWAEWLPSNKARFVVIVQSTAHPDPSTPVSQLAPAGRWTIQLTCHGGLAAGDIVDAWIARDDQIHGHPLRGRQSYFDDPGYERFDHPGQLLEFDNNSQVRREATLNSMATGGLAIVLGGYLRKERLPASYSAAGRWLAQPPPPAPIPRWPDAMTVSDDSRVHAGVLAAGSRSGSVVAMSGTSVAAPQVARAVADNLAAGGAGDRGSVQGWGATGIALPQPERSGAGGIEPPPRKPARYDGP